MTTEGIITAKGRVGPANRQLTVAKVAVSQGAGVDPRMTRIVLAYAAFATVWLVIGTLIGEFMGFALVWPEMAQVSWLSFGRLRPVHTNMVFWGWASLGMLGLGHYVVTVTSRVRLHSYALAWVALGLINLTVVVGTLFLLAGVNNGGQEYREYIWPAMLPFALALMLTGYNFYRTIESRQTDEIYISNWWILSAIIWTTVLATIAYLPGYQEGMGQTIIQGYYMHQGVGMWFTPMVLGMAYYLVPKLLNTPIYSYSLGALAFSTQLLFYTMIGTHHFIFSPVPWWLQTVAIVFSIGMVIPVVAGTANFALTARGKWSMIRKSYALPFLAAGIFYYCFVSLQGSLEALRTANLYWHFTNFTVGHSHFSMYGFITFMIWGGIYGMVPHMTGRNPRQLLVGVHFWLAFVGIGIYGVSLSIGGHLQGVSWIAGEAFMESVRMMAPFWLWRAVGGTLMFVSHLLFAYNFWHMLPKKQGEDAAAPAPDETGECEQVMDAAANVEVANA
ncbi:cbb3-type cytochrome c oxidase subunit I [Bradymonas sediminis]|uniref:Cytochrome oxidase subunit I n=1 Tax=Bradymonas sediminis TaxID=1548548 RepID=A0A2Z4FPX2_9DELT|nr:cbb3-type cytochrome c oxidase subunit I [Bradymonas sediminis]AWV90718.1 cytochrome oxidase subunit I [Bradymonas sediminis]TDP62641.1 cytochrome c oxidase cbb3-type subunit 1 [Bradymonas sediminis]